MSDKKEFAAEAGHWYLRDGTPFYTVIGKTTGTERPVTIRDAREADAVPSVTTIMKLLKSDGLSMYFERQIFDAVLKWPRKQGEDDYDYFGRIKAMSREHGRKASDRGTRLHAEVERFLRREPVVDKSFLPHIAELVRVLAYFDVDLMGGEAEKSFASTKGFGGKCDYNRGGDKPVVLDFKSKEKIEAKKRYTYDEHVMQLASYRMGLGMPTARCLNIFVGVEDRKVLVYEWEEADLQHGWQTFEALLQLWKLKNKYLL